MTPEEQREMYKQMNAILGFRGRGPAAEQRRERNKQMKALLESDDADPKAKALAKKLLKMEEKAPRSAREALEEDNRKLLIKTVLVIAAVIVGVFLVNAANKWMIDAGADYAEWKVK